MDIDYEKISLTADLAAYMRQFSDIPFASDVADLLHSTVHHPVGETGEIVSLRRLNLPAALLDPIKASLRLWVLSLSNRRPKRSDR